LTAQRSSSPFSKLTVPVSMKSWWANQHARGAASGGGVEAAAPRIAKGLGSCVAIDLIGGDTIRVKPDPVSVTLGPVAATGVLAPSVDPAPSAEGAPLPMEERG
jgi:hypothetical protein